MSKFGLVALITLTSLNAVAATSTSYQYIHRIQIDGSNGYYYFTTENGAWEAGDCMNAKYAYVKSKTIESADQILSVALAAKMAKKKVQFTGTCDSNENYLQATKIWLE